MKFYQSKLLNSFANLTHCFTTKQSGNLAFHVNDNPEYVLQNHQKLAQKLKYDLETLVHMKQIHSNRVKIVTQEDNFQNPPTCDALITDKKNIPLMVMVADCSPILLYDPKKEVIAVAHAGRAGAFHNIIKNVIKSFIDDFGSNPSDILASIGPSICQKCYEVNAVISLEAKEQKLDFALTKEGDKFYLDIRKILETQLLEAKIKKENIEISQLCSKCNQNYYSYRENRNSGRFCALLYKK